MIHTRISATVANFSTCYQSIPPKFIIEEIRLWVNDYWEEAIEVKKAVGELGIFGVHLGQEDVAALLDSGGSGLTQIRTAGLGLGISTHGYAELSLAKSLQPSYVAIGPVFATKSKGTEARPQGVRVIRLWRQLLGKNIPLVAIGGIEGDRVSVCLEAGADCVAGIKMFRGENVVKALKSCFI